MSVVGYLKFPLWTLWRYLTDFRLALRNTRLVLTAFQRTIYLGYRAIPVLKHNETRWSERGRGRYIWKIAQKYWARWILERIEAGVDVEGLDRVDWSRPHIVVSNHQSTLDILLIVATVPFGRFVAKKEILAYPAVGGAARHGGQIIIDRKAHEQAMAAIRTGLEAWSDSNLIFFAEGTRTRTGELNRFKKGAFAMAKEFDLPIVPVAVSGTYDALPKGSLLRLVRQPRFRLEVAEEIRPQPGEDVPALCDRTRDVIAGMIREGEPAHRHAYVRSPSFQPGS